MQLSRAALELSFYRRLLDLSGTEATEPLLRDVLALLAEVIHADLLYLEVLDRTADLHLSWARDPGLDLGAVRSIVPREIVRTVLARIEPVIAPSSLCVPIEAPAGALYVARAAVAPAFTDAHRAFAELCARQLGEHLLRRDHRADRLSLRRATRRFQRRHVLAALERADWSIADAARELEVARSYLYKLVRSLKLQRV